MPVPTLILNKAGLARNQPYRRRVLLCVSSVGSKTATRRPRDHMVMERVQGVKRERLIWKYFVTVSKTKSLKQGGTR